MWTTEVDFGNHELDGHVKKKEFAEACIYSNVSEWLQFFCEFYLQGKETEVVEEGQEREAVVQ